MCKRVVALLLAFMPAALFADEPAAKRRVFVLHSGIHTILSHPSKNIAADQLERGLIQRGVAERDIVVLDNPFPAASWRDVFPWNGLTMYLDSTVPDSAVCKDRYLRMHKALAARGVSGDDEVVWIGHSAGGQIGLSMACLACKLDKHPELAKAAKPYRLSTVITLGTPLVDAPLPSSVKHCAYYSPKDTTVHMATSYGAYPLFALGLPVPALRRLPASTSGTCCVRIFPDVQHNNWPSEGCVLDCIMGEFQAGYCPCWRTPPPLPNEGLSLAQLLARALAEDCHVSLEGMRRRR